MNTICGCSCDECAFKGKSCAGCAETNGKPFGGECALAACCHKKGFSACAECKEKCALKARVLRAIQQLSIPDMGEVKELFALNGFFINLPVRLPSGESVKLLSDEKLYLGCQTEKKGTDRCYGCASDGTFLAVYEYGENGKDCALHSLRKI